MSQIYQLQMELASLLKTDKILMIIHLLINTRPFFFSLFIYLSILFLGVMSALAGARSRMFRFKSPHIRFLWTFQTAFFLAGEHVITACRYAKYVYFEMWLFEDSYWLIFMGAGRTGRCLIHCKEKSDNLNNHGDCIRKLEEWMWSSRMSRLRYNV